jgi:hypothetical protein
LLRHFFSTNLPAVAHIINIKQFAASTYNLIKYPEKVKLSSKIQRDQNQRHLGRFNAGNRPVVNPCLPWRKKTALLSEIPLGLLAEMS